MYVHICMCTYIQLCVYMYKVMIRNYRIEENIYLRMY